MSDDRGLDTRATVSSEGASPDGEESAILAGPPLAPRAPGPQPKRFTPGALKHMTAQHKLLVDYMVAGCPHPHVRDKFTRPAHRVVTEVLDGIETQRAEEYDRPVEPGEPLRLEEAAELVGMRRRAARLLMREPVVERYMATEVAALRNGHKLEAVQTQIAAMRRKPVNDKAADAKVRLEAAAAVLGEQGDKRAGVTVNVGVGVQVSPGYVIDLRPADAGPVIEGEASEVDR